MWARAARGSQREAALSGAVLTQSHARDEAFRRCVPIDQCNSPVYVYAHMDGPKPIPYAYVHLYTLSGLRSPGTQS